MFVEIFIILYYNYFVKYACDFSLILLEPCNFQYYSTTPSINPPPLIKLHWRRGRGAMAPPIVETRRKIVNVVGIFVVKHTCIYAGPPSASSKKCYESNYNVLIRNIFYQKSCRRGDSLSEKYCPWPPKKHGTHDAPAMLPFSAVFKKHHRNL